MLINKKQEKIDGLIKKLNKKYENESFTESTVENIQDDVEHELLTYSRDDIDNSRFLELAMVEEIGDASNSLMQLFITDKIHITIQLKTNINGSGFMKLSEVKNIKIHS